MPVFNLTMETLSQAFGISWLFEVARDGLAGPFLFFKEDNNISKSKIEQKNQIQYSIVSVRLGLNTTNPLYHPTSSRKKIFIGKRLLTAGLQKNH